MSVKLLTYDVYRTGMTLFKNLADETYQTKELLPVYRLGSVPKEDVPAGFDSAYGLTRQIGDGPETLIPRSEIIGIRGSKAAGIIFAYTTRSSAFSKTWLSENKSGSPALIPSNQFLYLILSTGIYHHTLVMYDDVNEEYIKVMDASDIIFAYTIAGATPFSDSWLSKTDADGSGTQVPLIPQSDKLYIVLSNDKYHNYTLRYDEPSTKYELLSGGGAGGAIFSYIRSGATLFSSTWLSTTSTNASGAGGAALEPEEGLLYLIRTPGTYENIMYRYDATAQSYIEVIRCPILSFAPKFSVNTSYAIGELCTYENELYQFTAAHSAGAWNPAHVGNASTNIATVLSSLKSGIDTQLSNLQSDVTSQLNTTKSEMQTYVQTQLSDVDSKISTATTNLHTEVTGEISTVNTNLTNSISSVRSDLTVQFTTMPEASATYADKVLQYIGATNATYIYGHYYKCENNSGTYSWVSMGMRNNVKSNGTAMSDRSGIDFIDFDLTDDSTNNDTNVKPHEITTAEWNSVFENLPGYPTIGLCVDLSGKEYVVGNYSLANGTSKAIYCRSIAGTTISSGTYGTIPTGLTNIDLCWIESFVVYGTNYTKNLISDVSISSNGSQLYMVSDLDSIYRNKSFVAVVYYTKEVD